MKKNGKDADRVDVRLKPKKAESHALGWPNLDVGRWLDTLRRDFDAMMGDRLSAPRLGSLLQGYRFPRTDIADAGDHYELRAELPGIPKERVDVSVADGQLQIRADAGSRREEKGKNFYHREIESQSYYRSIPLPTDADPERVDAELKDGCLTIRLPKAPKPSRGRKVDVR